ncbi:hypothetical protein LQ567_22200 [Niabella pedocola]|uniref:Uncharacterized protein n=1 Tax=Niabella pedocola TaxID=1752077 RepID=A0ABS8PYV4_9BACT|nr:hypothetical protein [Niabella pedocola]MCD2425513.1 hypothetical protein [Niabella pedocola]
MRRILAYILFGLGLLTMTFFREYTGALFPYPSLFYFLGIAMFLGALLFLRYTPTTKEINAQKQLTAAIADLKLNGNRIRVDLTQCEVKEHNYAEERERYGHSNPLLTLSFEGDIQAWNAIGGGSFRNIEQVQVTQTVIVFNYLNQQTGKMEKYVSRVIPKDKVTLSFYMDKQKQTDLYVDKVNSNNYYFDLEFLNNEC